jgi:hypothetical protein
VWMGGSVGGEVRVRRWILIRSPRVPRFASWRGPRPPSGLAARVPIMYGDVEVRDARGGASVGPDSLSTHLAPLRVMEESAFSLPVYRSWMGTCGRSAPAYGRRNSGGGRIGGYEDRRCGGMTTRRMCTTAGTSILVSLAMGGNARGAEFGTERRRFIWIQCALLVLTSLDSDLLSSIAF